MDVVLQDELAKIKHWPADDSEGGLRFAIRLWHEPEKNVQEGDDKRVIYIRTNGWITNEALLDAMKWNPSIWARWRDSTYYEGWHGFSLLEKTEHGGEITHERHMITLLDAQLSALKTQRQMEKTLMHVCLNKIEDAIREIRGEQQSAQHHDTPPPVATPVDVPPPVQTATVDPILDGLLKTQTVSTSLLILVMKEGGYHLSPWLSGQIQSHLGTEHPQPSSTEVEWAMQNVLEAEHTRRTIQGRV